MIYVGKYENTMISHDEASTILALIPSSSQTTTTQPTTTTTTTKETLVKPTVGVDNNGWGVTIDPASGRLFYHHPLHGSQWEKPKGWVDQDQMTTANTSTSNSTFGTGSGNSGTSGSSSSSSGNVTGKNTVLPYGWSAAVDPATGRIFYYHTGIVSCIVIRIIIIGNLIIDCMTFMSLTEICRWSCLLLLSYRSTLGYISMG